uniref:Nrap protein domain-containing protein n=1 Tax=Arundo donax TaxID=35708 RepID=A0A0A9D8N7_ARUDO
MATAAAEDSIDRKLFALVEEARPSDAALRAAAEAADAVAELIKRVPQQQATPEAAQGFVRDLGLGGEKLAFTFRPPEMVRVAGSHAAGAVARPDVAADLLVRLPKECFHEKDFLNHRYHAKRCLYLCVIEKTLRSSQLIRKVSWSTFQDEARKPVLHVYPGCPSNKLHPFPPPLNVHSNLMSMQLAFLSLYSPVTFQNFHFVQQHKLLNFLGSMLE